MRFFSVILTLLSLLAGCRAEADFSKDMERIGFLFGAMRQGRIVDSGQIQCYDTGNATSCQNALYPGQDADYVGVPKPRSISAPIQKSYGDLVTIDYGTGLIWTSCLLGNAGSPDNTPACTGSAVGTDLATARSYCSALNSREFGGLTDWHLPTIRDLKTLVIHVMAPPYYDTVAFPGGAAVPIWSDSTMNGMDVYVSFGAGMIYTAGTGYSIRCVSGPSIKPGNFAVIAGGVVRDADTGLVFTRCAAGQNEAEACTGTPSIVDWTSALQYCHNLNKDGRRWRLPAIQELETLLRLAEFPAIDASAFPNTSGVFWSATTSPSSMMNALVINFDTGGSYSDSGKGGTAAVRCVSGP